MKANLAICAAIPALMLAAGSAHATPTIVPLDGAFLPTQFFYTVDAGPAASFAADYGATPKTATTANGAFDYLFEFTVPAAGTGNGSFSATFTSSSALTGVTFDGVTYSYPVAGASMNVAPFMVSADQLNTIEVTGNLGTAKALTFDGTVTFVQGAVPEPASWATFLVGFGFMGMALRRKVLRQFQPA